jgi:hypothetical protein
MFDKHTLLTTSLYLISFLPISSFAGYFEISGSGSYYKYDNGELEGRKNTTTVKRWGTGLAYRFMQNTAVEFSYSNSTNLDDFAYNVTDADGNLTDQTVFAKRSNQYQNYSLNLVLEFADRNDPFKPFIRGGGGVMKRKMLTTGVSVDRLTNASTVVNFSSAPESLAASAEAGIGFKVYVSNSTAIELSGTIFATDLDKEEIFLHYAVTGGLRFIFQ